MTLDNFEECSFGVDKIVALKGPKQSVFAVAFKKIKICTLEKKSLCILGNIWS